MKLIIWLGNPGEKYEKTRHNVWCMFLDFLASELGFSDFKYESKFKWEISNGSINWEKTILLKPQTFMNLSWESLRKIVDFYKISLEDWTVIYDDFSLEFWKIRFRDKWSAGGHNGVKDIIRHFWENFKRIKVWIWFNEGDDVSDWVLSKFTQEELMDLDNEVYKNTWDILIKNI